MTKQRNQKDIFDKIMSLPGIRVFEPFYKKYKEVLLYVFFGGLTSILSIVVYAGFNLGLGIDALIANVLSWIIAVTFAYITNQIWVFDAPIHNVMDLLKQMSSFFAGRLLTLLVEEAILLVLITFLQFPSMLVKIFSQVVVIVLNYIVSKFVVFRTK